MNHTQATCSYIVTGMDTRFSYSDVKWPTKLHNASYHGGGGLRLQFAWYDTKDWKSTIWIMTYHAIIRASKIHSQLSSCGLPMVPWTAATLPLCTAIDMHCRRYSGLWGSPVISQRCWSTICASLLTRFAFCRFLFSQIFVFSYLWLQPSIVPYVYVQCLNFHKWCGMLPWQQMAFRWVMYSMQGG